MEVRYFATTEALSNISLEIAQSLFVVIIILSALQINCCKKKIVEGKQTGSAQKISSAPESSPEASADKAASKTASKQESAAPPSVKSAKKSVKPIVKSGRSEKIKKKLEDVTQLDDFPSESEKEKADIVPMEKVQKLGNIDNDLKGKKMQLEKEIEEMKSTHEMDDDKPPINIAPTVHVKIDENKCKLYETNDEPTLDDEADDQLI